MDNATRRDIIVSLRVQDLNFKGELKKAQAHLNGLTRVSQQAKQQVAVAQQAVYDSNLQIKKALAGSQRQFAGWALSIMFFGMALSQSFNTIWKTSTKTFQDVMHSVEGTVTQFDLLEGSTKFLQYVAGEALEPIAAMLFPIINAVSDWILNNEELFRGIVVALGVGGTVLTALGMGKLALDGMATAMGLLRGVVGALSGGEILLIAAALAAIAGLAWKSFNETPDAWDAVEKAATNIDFTPLQTALKGIFTSVTDMPFDLENLAWYFAWWGSVAAGAIQIVVNNISILIDAFRVVIESAKLIAISIQAAFDADVTMADDAVKQAEKLKSAYDDIATAVKSQFEAVPAYFELVNTTPADYRDQILQQKQDTQSTQDLLQAQAVLQIQTVNVNGANMEDVLRELKTYAAGKGYYQFG